MGLFRSQQSPTSLVYRNLFLHLHDHGHDHLCFHYLLPSSYFGSHTSSPISTSPFRACVIPSSYSFLSYLTHTCGKPCRPASGLLISISFTCRRVVRREATALAKVASSIKYKEEGCRCCSTRRASRFKPLQSISIDQYL